MKPLSEDNHELNKNPKIADEPVEEGHKPDTYVADGLGDVLKRDWEQTKADLPGLDGEDTGQSITDTIRGEVHEKE